MHQRGYARNLLERFERTDLKPVDTYLYVNLKLTKVKQDPHIKDRKFPDRELMGALMYLAAATRPDISYAVSVLSQFNTFGQAHWNLVKCVSRCLQSSADLGVIYKPRRTSLRGYVNAVWASCLTHRGSYKGYAFIVGNAAVSWHSKKQPAVALSSTEAEYMGLAEATKETSSSGSPS
ncbi:secreted RxLR effector protein 161-like [Belonocnema kinseyi]|uniref:secreted RxLR effector protein 161-like n=1 Tax=Belonocnema kinseyi TaxID=2817044 RepID=UPI00143D4F67|nr:secreted RxLR effector protein 161-like [Belonocnema kinseyi]